MEFIKTTENVLQCPAWEDLAWLRHGFGTRQANPFPAVTLRQIHSADIHIAGQLSDREKAGDALVTNDVGCAIGVRTADCVPILILDPRTRSVAAIHAGWRGTAASIVKNAIETMLSTYGSKADELQAAIGPCIRACCYEVSEDVAARFEEACSSRREAHKPHLDLALANKNQMLRAGMLESQIHDSRLCTACREELFFSYRREPGNPGRMMTCISRTE